MHRASDSQIDLILTRKEMEKGGKKGGRGRKERDVLHKKKKNITRKYILLKKDIFLQSGDSQKKRYKKRVYIYKLMVEK